MEVDHTGSAVISGKINSKYSDLTVEETTLGSVIKIHKNGKRLLQLTVTTKRVSRAKFHF